MSHPTRRDLLAAGAVAGLASLGVAPPRIGAARNLVVVLAWGGWDSTVGLDPKPDGPVALPPGEQVAFGPIDAWVADDWPALGACLDRWSSLTHVVRGTSVRSVAHVVALRRLITGTPDPGAPDVGAIVGATLGADLPLPYLTLGVRSMPGSLAAIASTVGLNNQLGGLVLDRPLDATEEAALSRVVSASDRRWLSETLGARARIQVENLASARERAAALLGRDLGPPGRATSFADQTSAGIQALSEGLSRAVLLDSELDFDTHIDNYRQAELTDTLFQGVDALLARLSETPSPDRAGTVLLDDTVVLLVSEMTRTPRLNTSGGKDHWPWAVTALFGAGVRAGVTGTTDGEQAGQPVDLGTGGPGATDLRAENLAAGVLEHLGVDAGPWVTAPPLRSFTA